MPELPEVETMRRGILGAVGGAVTKIVREPCKRRSISIRPRIDAIARRTQDAKIETIDRVGKRVVLRFSTADCLVIEPRMTGLVLVADPPTQEHLRIRIDLVGCDVPHIWFWDRRGLGTVRLMSPKEQTEFLGPPKLGPDALDVTGPLLQQQYGASRRAVKVALLDQSKVAGIGNLYASEILHLARLDPRTACERLKLSHWEAIAKATREVLDEAILHEGSTLSDGTYRNALNQAGDYQNMHRVYDRAGETCKRCEGVIQRIVQAQRSTFFCDKCQSKRTTAKRAGAKRSQRSPRKSKVRA